MISESELRQKRTLVGLLAICCVVLAAILLLMGRSDAFASALLRVGLLLGAFWLALPTSGRAAAWARVSPWTVGLLVVAALLLQRFRVFLPVLLVGALIGWIVRPRNRKGS